MTSLSSTRIARGSTCVAGCRRASSGANIQAVVARRPSRMCAAPKRNAPTHTPAMGMPRRNASATKRTCAARVTRFSSIPARSRRSPARPADRPFHAEANAARGGHGPARNADDTRVAYAFFWGALVIPQRSLEARARARRGTSQLLDECVSIDAIRLDSARFANVEPARRLRVPNVCDAEGWARSAAHGDHHKSFLNMSRVFTLIDES